MSEPASELHPIVAEFIQRAVARLWRERRDTVEIAIATGRPEHEVCQILARLRDGRHAARQQGAARP